MRKRQRTQNESQKSPEQRIQVLRPKCFRVGWRIGDDVQEQGRKRDRESSLEHRSPDVSRVHIRTG